MNFILQVLSTETLEKDLRMMGSTGHSLSSSTGNRRSWFLLYSLTLVFVAVCVGSVDLPPRAMLTSLCIAGVGAVPFTTRIIRALDLHQLVSELARRRSHDVQVPTRANMTSTRRKTVC